MGDSRVARFVRADGGPFALAVFRIALFAVVLRMTLALWGRVVTFAGLPRSSIVPPWRLRRVLAVTPISPGLARAAGALLVVACVCGIAGLYARTAAAVTTVTGVYFLGIPAFFGKVDHGMHVLWFAALLAVSPCADVLSVDGARRAWRRADTGDVAPPAPGRAYGLPLRLVWLLVGAVYLFPGLAKVRSDGLHWAWSDNLRNIAFAKWLENDRLPGFARAVESHGTPLRLVALGALVFEIGFTVALFWRTSRIVAVSAGLTFHVLARYVLLIDFWPLYWLYVVFVPWDDVFAAVGRRLFRTASTAVYDDGCGICRRTVATLRTVDLLRRVEWVPASTADVGIARDALLADLHHVEDGRVTTGFEAYRRIVRRYPLLWPALPLLHLPPVAALGRRVYRHVADTRACAVAPLPAPTGPTVTPPRPRAVAAVFATIAVPAFALGLLRIDQAWPVAMYPGFEGYHPATLARVDATADGVPYDLRAALGQSPPGWTAISRRLAGADEAHRGSTALALYRAACAADPSLRGARVALRLSTVSTVPSQRAAPPLESVLVAEYGPGCDA
ncbi:MAG TPA: DCC1-like thiol-disulfide oxidoreductase family protein [Mycobacteriales bacterium]